MYYSCRSIFILNWIKKSAKNLLKKGGKKNWTEKLLKKEEYVLEIQNFVSKDDYPASWYGLICHQLSASHINQMQFLVDVNYALNITATFSFIGKNLEKVSSINL